MTVVDTARDILALLIRRYSFREVAALLGSGILADLVPPHNAGVAQQLCAYGQRMFDLDNEALANPAAATGANLDTTLVNDGTTEVPRHLVQRGKACRLPQWPGEQPRAALQSLVPAYQLLLEIIAARWRRRETAALLATAHIVSQYAYLLAWQPVLGHAGDPPALAHDATITGPDSRFGAPDKTDCAHIRPERAAASRALRVWRSDPKGWRGYLDRQHSTLARAFGVCAARCATPCTVVTSRTGDERERLAAACEAVFALADSMLIRLRHSAPVGHGFGVPSRDEVGDAWQHSRAVISRHGTVAGLVLVEDGYPLPGLPTLLSGVAGATLTADTLLADTAAEITAQLRPAPAPR